MKIIIHNGIMMLVVNMSKSIKMSFILNLIIFVLVFIATLFMVLNIKFMNVEDFVFLSSKIEVLKYYTVDFNIFMGVMSLIYCIYVILGKKMSKLLYILKLASTIGVVLTFLTVVFYLAPASKKGYFILFTNSNLFYHFIVPVLSFVTYVFFENNKLKIKDCLLSIIPTLIYALFYLFNVLVHLNNGIVLYEYDWYGFATGGIVGIIIVFLLMLFITFIIGVLLNMFNKICMKKYK